jgi:hypothetical protein
MTTETILETTVYGTASGNYDGSSLDFDSNGVQAVGYYAGQGSIQTVAISVSGFQGTITLQASLGDTLETALWFDVFNYVADSTLNDYHVESLIGNFVWMRARVTGFESGTINSITITY